MYFWTLHSGRENKQKVKTINQVCGMLGEDKCCGTKEKQKLGWGSKVTEQVAQGNLIEKVKFEQRLDLSKLDM